MNSVPVHFVDDGPTDAPVVVLSGSLGSDLRMWDPQVAPLLEAGLRVVRYDHRGHGGTPVPDPGPCTLDELGADVLALLDRLGIERAHFVGLSLGGMVGMWLGQHTPQRLRTLTLCCTSVDLAGTGVYGDRARLVAEQGVAVVAEAVVQRWFTPEWRAGNPSSTAAFEQMVAAVSAGGYAACCRAIETMDLASRLGDITTPVLILAGDRDQATPPPHARRLATAIPDARLEFLAPAAHLANVEQPTALTRAVLSHIGSNAAALATSGTHEPDGRTAPRPPVASPTWCR
ncbi:3-oxoadipate enol-lactonase [Nocardia sp. NPDC101769]|uniref:3-oxoadipate enol-lactonase n=1 Tax=Nocardia sp. NPDC101769 TaxID=3364333 RepID=UPI00380F99F3